MQKCLITGASGFLGREVMHCFSRTHDVVGVGMRHSGPDLIALDIRERDLLRNLVREQQPDVVIHLAAYREPDFCHENPEEARRLNVDPVSVLCEALPASTWLVLVSSDYVFDGNSPPYDEESPREPVSVYGKTKSEAEDLVMPRPRSIVLRVPLLIGAGATAEDSGFIAQMIQTVRSRNEVVLDDVLVRYPTWTRDAARAMAFLLSKGCEGAFHASGPRGGTRYAWTVEIARILGLSADHVKPSKQIVQRKAQRPVNSELATDKIQVLGYGPFTPFADVVWHVLGMK